MLTNSISLCWRDARFAYFAELTREKVRLITARKYWARHNVSDGYWASEQNIYSNYRYLDRKGALFTAKECREELDKYRQKSPYYKRIGKRLEGMALMTAYIRSRSLIYGDLLVRAVRSLKRRLKRGGYDKEQL